MCCIKKRRAQGENAGGPRTFVLVGVVLADLDELLTDLELGLRHGSSVGANGRTCGSTTLPTTWPGLRVGG